MTSVTHAHAKVPLDTLAARLVLLRHELGWTQRDAAAKTGVPYGTWQGMESGRETRSLDRHVAAIAIVSGYSRDWLMWGGTLEPTPFDHPGDSPKVTRYTNDSRVLYAVAA
jgi:transcriptional regulator with XRE-family HTH domain